MNDLFKILLKLNERKVPFCFQSQGQKNYYNLSIRDINGKQIYLQSDNLKDLEKRAKVFWGHLLKPIPLPKGFPIPR